MYMIPLSVLLENLGLTPEEFRSADQVTVPAKLFRFLLQATLAQSDFDEKGYLDANPDVAEAVARGRVRNARLHYVTEGYFESRQGGHAAVDEAWYLNTYPDVEEAVASGKIKSGAIHFAISGAHEFRAPAAEYTRDATNWAEFFGKY